jgi:hypothetical protein
MIKKQSDLGKLQVAIREIRENYSDILSIMQNIKSDKYKEPTIPGLELFEEIFEGIFLRLFSVNLYKTDYIHLVALLAGEGFLIYNPTPLSIVESPRMNFFVLQFVLFVFLWSRKHIIQFLITRRSDAMANEIDELLENTSEAKHSLKLKNAAVNSHLRKARGEVGEIHDLYLSVKGKITNQGDFLTGNTNIIQGGNTFLILGMIIAYYCMQMVVGNFLSVQGGGNGTFNMKSLDYYVKQLNKNSSRKKRSPRHRTRHNRSIDIPETIDTLYSMYLKDFPNGKILLVEILIHILIYRKSYKTIETYLKENNYTKLLSQLKIHTTKINIDLDVFKLCLRLGIGILVEYYIRIKNKEERHFFLNHLMSVALNKEKIYGTLQQVFSVTQGINPFSAHPSTVNHLPQPLLATNTGQSV